MVQYHIDLETNNQQNIIGLVKQFLPMINRNQLIFFSSDNNVDILRGKDFIYLIDTEDAYKISIERLNHFEIIEKYFNN